MADIFKNTLKKTIPFLVNDTNSLNIPRNRFIQKLLLRLVLNVTTGGTAPTYVTDSPMSIIKNIKLVADGNDTKLSHSLAEQWRINKYDHKTEHTKSNITATSTTGDSKSDVSIDFMLEPKDPLDFNALLKAHELSELTLFVDWGDTNDLATANAPTINSGSLTVTVIEVDLDNAEVDEILSSLDREDLWDIRYESKEKVIAGSNTNFAFEMDVPVGKIIPRIIATLIDNGIRDDAILTEFRIKQLSPSKVELIEQNLIDSKNEDKQELDLESIETGYTHINFEKQGGLDTRALKSGDILFMANTGTPTGTSKVRLVTQSLE